MQCCAVFQQARPDLLLLGLELAFDSDLLLLQNQLSVLLIIDVRLQAIRLCRDGQQGSLLLDPILLHVCIFLGEVGNRFLHVLDLGLLRPRNIGITNLRLQLGALPMYDVTTLSLLRIKPMQGKKAT